MIAATTVDTSGAMWATVGWLAAAVMIGFTVATWGLFTRRAWWEQLATVSAIVGVLTLVPYWFAADASGVANPEFDVAIHAAGSAAVLALLRVPRLEHWVHGHVVAGCRWRPISDACTALYSLPLGAGTGCAGTAASTPGSSRRTTIDTDREVQTRLENVGCSWSRPGSVPRTSRRLVPAPGQRRRLL